MNVPEAQKLREMEKENARLKRLLGERCIEVDVLKEALAKTGRRSPSEEPPLCFSAAAACPSAEPAAW